jgi:hypothetical protein
MRARIARCLTLILRLEQYTYILITMVVFLLNKMATRHGFVLSSNGEGTLICFCRTSGLKNRMCDVNVVEVPKRAGWVVS